MISLQTAPPLHEKLLTPYDTALLNFGFIFTSDIGLTLYGSFEDSNVSSDPLQQFLFPTAFKEPIQRLADLLLLPGSDRG